MRKRKKSKLLLVGGSVTLLTVVALSGWALGRSSRKANQEVPASQSIKTSITTIPQTEVPASQVPITTPKTTPPSTVAENPSETPTPNGMQLEQLLNGDFSSIEGVWVDGYGQTLTFGPTGLIDGRGSVQSLKATSWGTARGYLVTDDIGGAVLEFLPAGTVFPDHVYPGESEEEIRITDASDHQKERIWLAHDFSQIGDNVNFFYRQH